MEIRLPAPELTITSSDWTKSTLLTGTRGIACLAPATLLVVRSETYPETLVLYRTRPARLPKSTCHSLRGASDTAV